jgi:hypothetical protein
LQPPSSDFRILPLACHAAGCRSGLKNYSCLLMLSPLPPLHQVNGLWGNPLRSPLLPSTFGETCAFFSPMFVPHGLERASPKIATTHTRPQVRCCAITDAVPLFAECSCTTWPSIPMQKYHRLKTISFPMRRSYRLRWSKEAVFFSILAFSIYLTVASDPAHTLRSQPRTRTQYLEGFLPSGNIRCKCLSFSRSNFA